MRILVVEDEKKVSEFLRKSLIAEGHEICTCLDVKELDSFLTAKTFVPDIVLLDRNLGMSVDAKNHIPRIKQAFPLIKILILSAIGDPVEKAEVLDLGADDYLSKPFSFVELNSRLRSLARQIPQNQTLVSRNINLRDLLIDNDDRRVSCNGKRIDLTNKEFLLLKAFASHPQRIYNRFQLLDSVWNMQFDIESNVVEVTIKNLRRKLEDAGSAVKIESKRNVGYWVEN